MGGTRASLLSAHPLRLVAERLSGPSRTHQVLRHCGVGSVLSPPLSYIRRARSEHRTVVAPPGRNGPELVVVDSRMAFQADHGGRGHRSRPPAALLATNRTRRQSRTVNDHVLLIAQADKSGDHPETQRHSLQPPDNGGAACDDTQANGAHTLSDSKDSVRRSAEPTPRRVLQTAKADAERVASPVFTAHDPTYRGSSLRNSLCYQRIVRPYDLRPHHDRPHEELGIGPPRTLHLRTERLDTQKVIGDQDAARGCPVHSLTGDEPGTIEELPLHDPDRRVLLELGHYRPCDYIR